MSVEAIRTSGVVKTFSDVKGYGFITIDGDEDVFVHYTEIQGSTKRHRKLREGQTVSFELHKDERGLRAFKVQVI